MKLTETLKRRIDTFVRNLTDEEVNYLMETYFDRPKKALTIPVVVGQSEQLSCETCKLNCDDWDDDHPCASCADFEFWQAT